MRKKLGAGEKAPDFTLPDDRGQMVSLKSFAGDLIVLYFYPKDDTAGCTQEAIAFNALKHEFEKPAPKSLACRQTPRPVMPNSRRSTRSTSSQMNREKCSNPMVSGQKKACTGGNIWASSGRHS
jgi:hypothetical protein